MRIIVPYPPGGFNDNLARTLGQKLTEKWGQPVIVDNRPGGGGTICTNLAAKSAPDGYTLLIVSFAFAVNPALYASLPYDTGKDFVPIVFAANTPNLLVVHPELPVKSVKERSPFIKELPTVAESGVPGFDVSVWFGVVAPAGTPQSVIAKLNAELNGILKLAEIKQAFNNQGVEPVGGTPREFSSFLGAQTTKWAKVVRDSGAKAE